jgi:hypothetical protein
MTPLQLDVLRQFRKLGIRFLVVGGQAMRARGIDRPTRDLDLWIARDLANAEAMMRFLERVQTRPALERLQLPNFKFTVGDPARPEVDILTSVAGDPGFDDCLSRSQPLALGGQRLQTISTADLVAIKEASAQTMDGDAANAALSTQDRAAASGTAAKERRDIALLKLLLAAGG